MMVVSGILVFAVIVAILLYAGDADTPKKSKKL
jgi:hypothetical protein